MPDRTSILGEEEVYGCGRFFRRNVWSPKTRITLSKYHTGVWDLQRSPTPCEPGVIASFFDFLKAEVLYMKYILRQKYSAFNCEQYINSKQYIISFCKTWVLSFSIMSNIQGTKFQLFPGGVTNKFVGGGGPLYVPDFPCISHKIE